MSRTIDGVQRYIANADNRPADEIVHVTAGWIDVMGAMSAGMQSVWVNRKDEPWETFGEEPDLVIDTFEELEALLA